MRGMLFYILEMYYVHLLQSGMVDSAALNTFCTGSCAIASNNYILEQCGLNYIGACKFILILHNADE